MANRTVLYVSGFSANLRARDLAYEFERYGRLIRCDIPALKSASSSPFAFVEFRRDEDADEAYYDMHGRSIDGRRITVQWAKRPPSAAWRHDGFSDPRGPPGPPGPPPRDRRDDRDRDSGRRSPPPRRRSPSPRRDRDRRDPRDDQRRSLSPRRERDAPRDDRRSVSPGRERNGNGAASEERGEDDRERRDD